MAAPGAVRLARSSMLNLVGQGLPLVAALVAIPPLVAGLGTDRFGVLTLAWVLIGYFSLFDFGLGRALTQVVARHLGEGHALSPPVAWTALLLMFVLGCLGAGALALLAPWLVRSGLHLPVALQAEALPSMLLLAACIPLVIVTAGLIGILSAFQRFGVLNAIRAPMGVLAFVAPLATLPYSGKLVPVIIALVVVRVLGFVAHAVACRPFLPSPRGAFELDMAAVKPLFELSAWMTVTNLVAPLMLYLDRFLIASLLSVTAVAYYATPYEMVTRLLFVSGAISAVLFPAFAGSYRADPPALGSLLARGTKYVGLALFPAMLLVVAFAPEGLAWWLGADFARESSPVLRILAVGVFVNGVAQVFLALVQGVGRPDVTAKFHLLELPLYVAALWWAVPRYGIVGAAWVWSGRVLLDAVLLGWFARLVTPGVRAVFRKLTFAVAGASATLLLPLAFARVASRLAVVALVAALFVPVAWRAVLSEAERQAITRRLRPAGGA